MKTKKPIKNIMEIKAFQKQLKEIGEIGHEKKTLVSKNN